MIAPDCANRAKRVGTLGCHHVQSPSSRGNFAPDLVVISVWSRSNAYMGVAVDDVVDADVDADADADADALMVRPRTLSYFQS
jgi:hypothetical protein